MLATVQTKSPLNRSHGSREGIRLRAIPSALCRNPPRSSNVLALVILKVLGGALNVDKEVVDASNILHADLRRLQISRTQDKSVIFPKKGMAIEDPSHDISRRTPFALRQQGRPL